MTQLHKMIPVFVAVFSWLDLTLFFIYSLMCCFCEISGHSLLLASLLHLQTKPGSRSLKDATIKLWNKGWKKEREKIPNIRLLEKNRAQSWIMSEEENLTVNVRVLDVPLSGASVVWIVLTLLRLFFPSLPLWHFTYPRIQCYPLSMCNTDTLNQNKEYLLPPSNCKKCTTSRWDPFSLTKPNVLNFVVSYQTG